MSDETHRLAFSHPSCEVERLREALEPFSTFAETFVDEDGWQSSMRNERIVDWFGPSDFRRAAAALSTPETVSLKGDRV
jgi:hypothetical protein